MPCFWVLQHDVPPFIGRSKAPSACKGTQTPCQVVPQKHILHFSTGPPGLCSVESSCCLWVVAQGFMKRASNRHRAKASLWSETCSGRNPWVQRANGLLPTHTHTPSATSSLRNLLSILRTLNRHFEELRTEVTPVPSLPGARRSGCLLWTSWGGAVTGTSAEGLLCTGT